jgi:hypothetical protein
MKHIELINECNHNFSGDNYYVYELVDPRTNQPFYIGKGRDDRAARHIRLRNAKSSMQSNPHKANRIKQIIDAGHLVQIKVIGSFVDEEEAFKVEVEMIDQYGRSCNKSGILTNIVRGGEGYTQDGKPVDQYSMFGEYIKTWENAKTAARNLGYKTYSSICGCCKGRERSYRGYLWTYTGESPTLLTTNKIVYQWGVDGMLISRYENCSVAAQQLKCHPSTISDAVANRKGTEGYAVGYIWSDNDSVPAYNPRLGNRKMVKNITTGEMFDSVTAAAIQYDTLPTNISAACNGRQKMSVHCEWSYADSVQCLP